MPMCMCIGGGGGGGARPRRATTAGATAGRGRSHHRHGLPADEQLGHLVRVRVRHHAQRRGVEPEVEERRFHDALRPGRDDGRGESRDGDLDAAGDARAGAGADVRGAAVARVEDER